MVDDFIQAKRTEKEKLSEFLAQKEGVEISSEFLVFAQADNINEHNRQLMTAFAILELYFGIKCGRLRRLSPCVFIFSADGLPESKRAKAVIKFINAIASKINADKQTNNRLKTAFVQGCSEKIVAGTDVFLQVQTAGLEAGGTHSIKGAVVCGTGANCSYSFGATEQEIAKLKKEGYVPRKYMCSQIHRKAVESLIDGTFSDGGTGEFYGLYNSLISAQNPDEYLILYDLEAYVQNLTKICEDYSDKHAFAEKQLKNI